jgi:hypothetical protein
LIYYCVNSYCGKFNPMLKHGVAFYFLYNKFRQSLARA